MRGLATLFEGYVEYPPMARLWKRRGYMTPTIYYLSRQDFEDLTQWGDEDPAHKDSED